MEGELEQGARPASGKLTPEEVLFRVLLLAGWGRRARGAARSLAAAVRPHEGRSCLEGGAALQFTVDAPGPRGVRVGLQLGSRFDADRLVALLDDGERRQLDEALANLPRPRHSSVGTWLFWTRERRSIFVDLRDPDPAEALARVTEILDADQRAHLAHWRDRLQPAARPWALRLEADGARGLRRLHIHWLLARHASPVNTAEAIAPGGWKEAIRVWGELLRTPGRSGRFTFATPLDHESVPALRVGNSGWAIVPEDEAKHRAVGRLVRGLGGPADHAQALLSLLRDSAGASGRVGRACEVRVIPDGGTRARLFLVPDVQMVGTAVTSSSDRDDSWTGPTIAEPSSR